jgi:glucosylceramidase
MCKPVNPPQILKTMGRSNLLRIILLAASLLAAGFVGGQSGNRVTDRDSVRVWWSSELLPGSVRWFTDPPKDVDIRYRLTPQKEIGWTSFLSGDRILFNIDTTRSYQSVLGIGTSLEATSLYALMKNKNEKQIRDLIRLILDPGSGMGLNLFRITIGTSDFSDGRKYSTHPNGFFTYQDNQDEPFSIQPDIDFGIIKILRIVVEEAASLNQEIKFFASEWSPPSWMKTSENLIGGTLKAGYEKKIALYFRKFIEAYEKEGIPIYAITIQNEPNFTPDSYPGMKLSPEQEKNIAIAVFEEFNDTASGKRHIGTRIWINDHNMNHWVNADKVLNYLKDMGKEQTVDGVAFHNYNPMASPSNMSKLKKLHPDKDILLTEYSEWGVSGMYNIQNYFLNWSRSYCYWVPMTTIKLDEYNQGPYNNISELGPPLFIERGTDTTDMTVTPEFYLLSQFSKFIRPGAYRIECNPGSEKTITSVVFRNRDNTIVQILVNQTNAEQKFTTVVGSKCFSGVLPAGTVGTYKWENN